MRQCKGLRVNQCQSRFGIKNRGLYDLDVSNCSTNAGHKPKTASIFAYTVICGVRYVLNYS